MVDVIAPEEITRLKGLGFLRDKTCLGHFNGRVITGNGKISAQKLAAIAEAARRFGSGEAAMTTRLTVEIQGIPYENIPALIEFLAQEGLETGGTGAKVRPVVSCKGTTCQYGLIDTFGLSEEIHRRFYQGYHDMKLPHKFKIAVGGCPNNCVKPELNDLGIIGQRIPQPDEALCRNCKKCAPQEACPLHVIVERDGKKLPDSEECNHCGRCVSKCPFGVYQKARVGYRVVLGGRWGKKTAVAQSLDRIFTEPEEVLELVERVILFYRDHGQPGERFADTIARLGFSSVQQTLLSPELDR